MVPASPADAVNLAGDLETLMDAFTTEGIDWHALELAVDADYSNYFEITRHFVQIASEYWPQDSGRAPGERSGAAAQRPARGGSAAPHPRASRPSDHRRGLDRLDAGDRKPHGARSRACPRAPSCCPASTRISTRRAGATIGGARRRRDRSGAQPPAGLARGACVDRHLRVPRAAVTVLGRGAGSGASAQPRFSRKPCARPTPPTAGR